MLLVMAFGSFIFVLFFSAILEAVVEFIFGIPADYSPWLTKNKGWMIPIVTIAVAITGAFIYKLDLFYIYGQFIEGIMFEIAGQRVVLGIASGPLGIVLTGILLARGSNFVHEIYKKYLRLDVYLKKWEVFGEPKPGQTPADEQ